MEWEIRFHGRGGQGVVTASKILAEVAFLNGYEAQSIPFFGAERRGSPVVASTRISTEKIRKRSQVYDPDYIVVFDLKILNSTVFHGLKENGFVIVNASKKFEVEVDKSVSLVRVDATRIAIKNGLFLGDLPAVNLPMLGAFLRVFPKLDLGSLEKLVSERFGERSAVAVEEAFESAVVEKVCGRCGRREVKVCEDGFVKAPISKPSVGVVETSLWRDLRPEINYDVCNNCLNCWLHCPEGAIKRRGRVEINYEFCKGCLICYEVCPKSAITFSEEVVA